MTQRETLGLGVRSKNVLLTRTPGRGEAAGPPEGRGGEAGPGPGPPGGGGAGGRAGPGQES